MDYELIEGAAPCPNPHRDECDVVAPRAHSHRASGVFYCLGSATSTPFPLLQVACRTLSTMSCLDTPVDHERMISGKR